MVHVAICPSCESKNINPYLSCTDYSVSHETFTVTTCSQCNLVMTNPRPSASDLGKYYKSENYISHSGRANNLVDRVYLFVRNYSLKWKLRLLQKYSSTDKVLDYGCGTGEFLKVCKNSHWKISGIEPSEGARQKAIIHTQEPIVSSLEELKEQDFNIITLWHVLEHVEDPSKTIQNLSEKLKAGGKIFVAVPNHTSYDAAFYKQFWAGYDVPRHLWHFSQQSMKIFLEKNSLKIEQTIPMKLDSFYVSLLSEKYKGTSTVIGFIKALALGWLSNLLAMKSGNYSSLIYIVSK